MPYCNKHSSQGNITWMSTASSISQPLVTSEVPRCPVKHFSFTKEADFSKRMRQFSFPGRNAKPEAAPCTISPTMEGNVTTHSSLVAFPSLAGQPRTLVTRVTPWRYRHCLEQHRLWAYYRGLLYYRLGAWLSPFPKHMFKLSFAGLSRATGPRQCRALPRHQILTEPWAGSECPFPSTSQHVHSHRRPQHLEEARAEAMKLPAGRQTRPRNCGLGAAWPTGSHPSSSRPCRNSLISPLAILLTAVFTHWHSWAEMSFQGPGAASTHSRDSPGTAPSPLAPHSFFHWWLHQKSIFCKSQT